MNRTRSLKKAHLVRVLWIIFCSGCVTFKTSLAAITRHWCGWITRSWVDKALYKWTDSLLHFARVHYIVNNPFKVAPQPGKPTIIMCNHASMYDIPLGYKAFPNHSMRMLAKKELSKVPIFGKGMRSAEFVFIDRKNRSKAMQDLEKAKALMQSGIVLWVAPEGTRSKTGELKPFKKGAFIMAIEAGATIIPMGIKGAFDILPPKKLLAINLNQQPEICIGKPIEASNYSQETKDELIKRTWDSIYGLIA